METLTSSPVASSPAADLRKSEIVARLQASAVFLNYQEAFQTATGLPLVLRPVGAFRTPLADSRRMNPFCAQLVSLNKACASCLELQARMEKDAGASAVTLQCFTGLSESAVPVRLGDRSIAYLQTGQVLLHKPTRESFQTAVRQLREWGNQPDLSALETAYFRTRIMPKAQYEAVLKLLESFAAHLSIISNELMLKQATPELPAITKARTYIADHLAESISLTDVARVANMSSFHFCKVFKGALGVTFTDYLARARVEKTKQLLINPHKRVSEAAYEVGFQSLSQFNRAFRRITGETPSAYREHLQGVATRMGSRRVFERAA